MKAKNNILKIFIVLQCLFPGNSLRSQIDGNVKTKLDTYLSVQRERVGLNGVVLIADRDSVLYQRAMGQSSIELRVPLAMDTKFKIASMTKSFAGMLLALSEQEGKLGFDDTLKAHFPGIEMKPEWERITLKELVSHNAGIPHWKGYRDYWPERSRIPLDDEQVLADIFAMELIVNAHNSAHYSSPAYFLLATILERVHDKPYGQIFRERIAAPLGMDGSGVYDGVGIVPGMASGYHMLPNDSLISAPYRDMSTMKGGGDLYSNANDLLKWNRSLMGNGPWAASLLKRYFAPLTEVTFPRNNDARYSMGQYIHSKTAVRPMAYQTAGGTFGFSSLSVIYPEEEITLIVLGNVSFLPVNGIWADLERIIFEMPFKLPEIVEGTSLSEEELGAYPGTYVADNGMELEIVTSQDGMYAKLGSNPPLKIVHKKDNSFKAVKIDVSFEFTLSDNGTEVKGVIANKRGQVHNFKRK